MMASNEIPGLVFLYDGSHRGRTFVGQQSFFLPCSVELNNDLERLFGTPLLRTEILLQNSSQGINADV